MSLMQLGNVAQYGIYNASLFAGGEGGKGHSPERYPYSTLSFPRPSRFRNRCPSLIWFANISCDREKHAANGFQPFQRYWHSDERDTTQRISLRMIGKILLFTINFSLEKRCCLSLARPRYKQYGGRGGSVLPCLYSFFLKLIDW